MVRESRKWIRLVLQAVMPLTEKYSQNASPSGRMLLEYQENGKGISMIRSIKLLVLIMALLAGGESLCSAQIPRYSPPSGSTLPNQLNYFRRDSGVLDPYNSIVEPIRQVSRQFQAQEQQNKQFTRDLITSRSELEQIRETDAGVTGTSASFMNNGRYFMNSAGAGNVQKGNSRKYSFSNKPRVTATQAASSTTMGVGS
jgi:hypothetical protein